MVVQGSASWTVAVVGDGEVEGVRCGALGIGHTQLGGSSRLKVDSGGVAIGGWYGRSSNPSDNLAEIGVDSKMDVAHVALTDTQAVSTFGTPWNLGLQNREAHIPQPFGRET